MSKPKYSRELKFLNETITDQNLNTPIKLTTTNVTRLTSNTPTPIKRGRGRPPKHPKNTITNIILDDDDENQNILLDNNSSYNNKSNEEYTTEDLDQNEKRKNKKLLGKKTEQPIDLDNKNNEFFSDYNQQGNFSDIISIKEMEENEINLNDSINNTNPFSRILQLCKDYGFNTIIDYLINLINPDNQLKNFIGIENELKEIVRNLNIDTFNLYLIKLSAYNQKMNFELLNEFKQSQKAKEIEEKNLNKIINEEKKEKKENKKKSKKENEDDEYEEEEEEREEEEEEDEEYDDDEFKIKHRKKRLQLKNDSKIINKEDISETNSDKNSWKGYEKLKEKRYCIRRGKYGGTNINSFQDNIQYRSRHFLWKNGKLHSFTSKMNLKARQFFLYCWKMGCRAKIRIDMDKKTAKEYGQHCEHRGIVLDQFSKEYPGLADDDWKNIQYDVKNGERILAWKIMK